MLLLTVAQLLKLVCVGGADELAIHVEDLAVRVHEELAFIALDLDSPHEQVVPHVHTHLVVSRCGLVSLLLLAVQFWLRVLVTLRH